MTTRAQREFLRVQLLETQRLKEMVSDHPLMSISFAEREQELKEKIAALPPGNKEARTILFFSGEPVQGSMGIDASFAGRVLQPFQSMVMADYGDRWHGMVGSRGRRPGEAQSRLLLTGLPRGSFGLELTRVDNDELFEEGQLADTLAHVTRLVEAAGRSDEDFAAQLDETAPRVIKNLREFLEVIAKGKAGLRLESGDFRCSLNPVEANEAFNRVSKHNHERGSSQNPRCIQGCIARIVEVRLRLQGKSQPQRKNRRESDRRTGHCPEPPVFQQPLPGFTVEDNGLVQEWPCSYHLHAEGA